MGHFWILFHADSTRWGGHLFRRFCSMFSESSLCLLGQHGSCSSAQLSVELSENIVQNLSEQMAAPPGIALRVIDAGIPFNWTFEQFLGNFLEDFFNPLNCHPEQERREFLRDGLPRPRQRPRQEEEARLQGPRPEFRQGAGCHGPAGVRRGVLQVPRVPDADPERPLLDGGGDAVIGGNLLDNLLNLIYLT